MHYFTGPRLPVPQKMKGKTQLPNGKMCGIVPVVFEITRAGRRKIRKDLLRNARLNANKIPS